MSWLHISDGFPHHPKLLSLTRPERWQWLTVLCYCARYRSGDVDTAVLRHLGISRRLLGQLLELRLLEHADAPDTWHVHDWEHFNPPPSRDKPEEPDA